MRRMELGLVNWWMLGVIRRGEIVVAMERGGG